MWNFVVQAKAVMVNMMNAVSSMTSSLSGTTHLGENKQIGTAEVTASVHAVEPSSTQPTTIVQEPVGNSTSLSQQAAVYLHPNVFASMPNNEPKMIKAQV